MEENKRTSNLGIKATVIIVLFCVYIFPTGIIETEYQLSKFIFLGTIGFIYFFTLNKINIKELFFILIIIIMVFFSKNMNYCMFITLVFLDKILKYSQEIKEYLKRTYMPYICLAFTLVYTIIFAGTNGRYAFAAIKEINQSGLAIFCLAMILLQKNKKIGILTLCFGCFTMSRSYYLALLIYIISNLRLVKKIIIKDNLIKFCTYTNLTIISSIILIFLGIFYIKQYELGNIYWGDDISNRLYTFLDYSNFFRFTAIINLVFLFKNAPQKLLFGVTKEEFITDGIEAASEIGIPYKYVVPHNLFYSHLKIYGCFSVIETIYISKILNKVVNKSNFLLYIAISLYSFILGAGMYSYWLYLTVFMLIVSNKEDNMKEVS